MNAAKSISVKQGDQCEKGQKNTTEIYGLLVLRLPRFRNTLTERGIFLSGARLSLLSVTLTGLHEDPNNINRDSGIEIPEAWIPRIKQHNSRSKRSYDRTPSNNRNNNKDRNAPIAANHRATNSDT